MKEGTSAPFFCSAICGRCPYFWTLYIVAATGALAPRCRGCARPALRWCVLLGGAGPLPRPPAALDACMVGVALGAQGPVAPPLSRARLARCGTQAVCGPCRAPRPCCLRLRSRSPLRLAAGCGLARLNPRFALRGRAGARPLRRGASAPRPRRRLRCGLPPRLAGPCPGCASARAACPRPRPAPPGRRRPRPCALRAPGGPSGSPRRASLPPALPPRGARLSGFALAGRACLPRPAASCRPGAVAVVRLRARGWGFRRLRAAGITARRGRAAWNISAVISIYL